MLRKTIFIGIQLIIISCFIYSSVFPEFIVSLYIALPLSAGLIDCLDKFLFKKSVSRFLYILLLLELAAGIRLCLVNKTDIPEVHAARIGLIATMVTFILSGIDKWRSKNQEKFREKITIEDTSETFQEH